MYNNKNSKIRRRQNPKNSYSKEYKTTQNSPEKLIKNSQQQNIWDEYEKQYNQPGLIGILKYNQNQVDLLPDNPK